MNKKLFGRHKWETTIAKENNDIIFFCRDKSLKSRVLRRKDIWNKLYVRKIQRKSMNKIFDILLVIPKNFNLVLFCQALGDRHHILFTATQVVQIWIINTYSHKVIVANVLILVILT